MNHRHHAYPDSLHHPLAAAAGEAVRLRRVRRGRRTARALAAAGLIALQAGAVVLAWHIGRGAGAHDALARAAADGRLEVVRLGACYQPPEE